ncbi:MAG: glycosyltransferase family 2 protein [Candidatus Altiarchaeota archaeon]
MKKSVDLSVLVPANNERGNIRPLYLQLTKVLAHCGLRYEIVFVDDCSTDGTYEEMKSVHGSDGLVRVVRLHTNLGQTAALDVGFRRCRGDVVVQMDADLQNDPSDIPKLIKRLDDGYDCVCGWRRDRNDPLLKRFVSSFGNLARTLIVNDGMHDEGCSLRAYRGRCLKGLRLRSQTHRFIPTILYLRGFRVCEIETKHNPRTWGASKYGPLRVIRALSDLLRVRIDPRFYSGSEDADVVDSSEL